MNSRFIPNSFIVPNSVVDELMADMSGVELKCYLFVVRKTKGWNKECDAISLTQFVKFTGAGKTAVVDALKNLVDLGLLVKKTGVRNTSVYAINSFGNQTSSESELVQKANSTSSESELVTSSESEHTKNNNINTTTKNKNNNTRTAKTNVKDLLAEYGVTGQLADEFIAHRKCKKAPITERVMTLIANNARIAGIETSFAIEIILARGTWVTFDASWNWQSTASSLRNEKAKTGKFDAHNGLRDRDLGKTEIPSWALDGKDGESEV
ncbi:replication protein [Haemophilus parainfluenzae]|jgi:phage replication O-like protein O|uniref:replication protein n=1 Tax=Haemophilus parainfluenzae TaxID=729 RepID=UPI000DAC3EA6|nr:replication protein [Haemophilus parainfluenzae]MDU5697103.1 replication protein [Haemophilus parainfluenzae]RDE78316.1 hypothetical protein DPV94_00590 [Haemophilus parainfluenzae]DAX78732.1 MAG TPA: replication protein O [Caudoviricetes sp.]